MTPYYDDGQIVIYHGDCHDILPDIDPASVDLVLTDPPYGINYSPSSKHKHRAIAGDAVAPTVDHLLPFGRLVIFGGHYMRDLPPTGGWIVWDKRLREDNLNWPDGDMAWTNVDDKIRIYRQLWAGPIRPGEPSFVHPTQKPVALMRWILDRYTTPGDLVLDPYMGSGPVAQACYELGRRYIGIEIVEDYCQVAVDRLKQGVLPL